MSKFKIGDRVYNSGNNLCGEIITEANGKFYKVKHDNGKEDFGYETDMVLESIYKEGLSKLSAKTIGEEVLAVDGQKTRKGKIKSLEYFVGMNMWNTNVDFTDGQLPSSARIPSKQVFSIPSKTSIQAKKYLTIINVTTGQSMTAEGSLRGEKDEIGFATAFGIKNTADYSFINIHIEYMNKEPKIFAYWFPNHMEANLAYSNYCFVIEPYKMVYGSASKIDFLTSAKNRATALAKVFDKIIERFPSDHVAIKSTGHGTDLGIFEGTIYGEAIHDFLGYCKQKVGKNLAFLDFSTNCNAGSGYNINHCADYADYIMASEFTRTDATGDTSLPIYPSRHYDIYWQKGQSIVNSLNKYMDDYNAFWNAPSSQAKSKQKESPQSINLYQSDQLSAILAKAPSLKMDKITGTNTSDVYIHPDSKDQVIDWKLYLASQTSDADSLWNSFNINRVTNNHNTGYDWSTNTKEPKLAEKSHGLFSLMT